MNLIVVTYYVIEFVYLENNSKESKLVTIIFLFNLSGNPMCIIFFFAVKGMDYDSKKTSTTSFNVNKRAILRPQTGG